MKRGVEKSIRWHGGQVRATEVESATMRLRLRLTEGRGLQKASTEYVVVSIHGWSASCRELQPLDEMLADHLRANLYRHRLTGHGLLPMVASCAHLPRSRPREHPVKVLITDPPRYVEQERSGEAMRDMTAEDLFRDVVDSFNCGTILGEKIILLASSTGAALSTWLCSRRYASSNYFLARNREAEIRKKSGTRKSETRKARS
eukprot:scaffold7714_cov458-Pinguiococcus_pyrenoidosus.AAC.2